MSLAMTPYEGPAGIPLLIVPTVLNGTCCLVPLPQILKMKQAVC